MRILITGASGFIGRALAERLSSRHKLFGLFNEPAGVARLRGLRVKPVIADITKRASVEKAVNKLLPLDVVYHLAAVKTAARPMPTDKDCWRVNSEGTQNVCDACASARRIVYASSILVYGDTPARNPIPESAACRPKNAYGASKYAGEKIVARSGVPFTTARIAIGYGPGDTGTVPKIISFIKHNAVVPVIAAEKQLHLTYIDDIVDAFVKMLASKKTINQTYNIAGPEPVTMGRLVSLAEQRLAVSRLHVPLSSGLTRLLLVPYEKISVNPIVTREQLDTLLSGQVLNVRKAREFGWRPKVWPSQGISNTIEWLKRGEGL